MITRQEFASIDKEVREAIEQTLENLRANRPDNYVLFLADGEYNKQYDHPDISFSPFVIDNRMDKYKDESRLQFLSEFLNTFYLFPSTQEATDDNQQRMHMELMIYTHIWESKPFLKKLYRLAHLSIGEEYTWDVTIPEMGKHNFIRNDIRKTFDDIHSPLAGVIRKGFHTSLRNAFAHSQYAFDTMNGNRRIWLDNENPEGWELTEISFDDWSKRFVYSALLSYYLLDLTHKSRTALTETFGTDTFIIQHPKPDKSLQTVEIVYRAEHDGFNFRGK